MSGQKLVLIDDEPGVLIALKLLIQMLGFSVEVFSDPDLALPHLMDQELAGTQVDIILCDLRMPVKSGMDVLKEVKKFAPKIKFILMSGHADEREQQEAIELGAAGFLAKPFDPESFKKLVAEPI